jgi:hypothetical protein
MAKLSLSKSMVHTVFHVIDLHGGGDAGTSGPFHFSLCGDVIFEQPFKDYFIEKKTINFETMNNLNATDDDICFYTTI